MNTDIWLKRLKLILTVYQSIFHEVNAKGIEFKKYLSNKYTRNINSLYVPFRHRKTAGICCIRCTEHILHLAPSQNG